MSSFPLFPEAASSIAHEVDLIYFFILAVCSFFAIFVSALVVFFAVKFRRRHPDEVGADIHGSIALELLWTIIPVILSLVMFVWGADLYFRIARPPADSMEVFVVGNQWMWKVQHPEAVREPGRARPVPPLPGHAPARGRRAVARHRRRSSLHRRGRGPVDCRDLP